MYFAPTAYGLACALFGMAIALLSEHWIPLGLGQSRLGGGLLFLSLAALLWSSAGTTFLWGNRARVLLIAAAAALLFPTAGVPGIAGAVLVLLVGFRYSERHLVTLGIVALVVFVAFFYYSLASTLLQKSYLLLGSGLFFLLAGGGVFLFRRRRPA